MSMFMFGASNALSQSTKETINDNDILLKKLKAVVFLNHTIDWFKSYFSNGCFRVDLENCYSDPSYITFGVPKGSILEPLLFLIYVNDMSQAVKSDLFLYTNIITITIITITFLIICFYYYNY